MSDCINTITFNKDRLFLEMRFDGDDYETATMKCSLKGCHHGPLLEEDVVIPVRCLFSLGYLILMSVRRTGAEYEKEAQEMQDRIEMKKHPLDTSQLKGKKKDVKKNKAKANRNTVC